MNCYAISVAFELNCLNTCRNVHYSKIGLDWGLTCKHWGW